MQDQDGQSKPAEPLSREQVKEYLGGIETLLAKAGDRGRAPVRSLVENHGLSAQVLDGQNIKIAMTLAPPGTAGQPLKVETVATVSSGNKIDLWLQAENAKGTKCACGCGRRIEVRRRHYWRGLAVVAGLACPSHCSHDARTATAPTNTAQIASVVGDRAVFIGLSFVDR